MRKIFKYLFLGVGLLYTYAIARMVGRALAADDTSADSHDDMLIH